MNRTLGFWKAVFESWCDVPIAEISEMESVRVARRRYDTNIERERNYFSSEPHQAALDLQEVSEFGA